MRSVTFSGVLRCSEAFIISSEWFQKVSKRLVHFLMFLRFLRTSEAFQNILMDSEQF